MQTQQTPIGSEDPAEALRVFIANGGYSPGDRLPPERELIFKLGFSRTNLRKGLDTLERQGAIWRHVGKGTFVAAHSNANGEGGLLHLSQQVSPVDMMRARLSLEPALAREAAINASDDAVVRVKLARDRAEVAASWDAYEAQDDAFHRAVAEATGNVLLLSLFDQLNQVRRAVAWNAVTRSTAKPPRNHSSYEQHDVLTSAIEARDPHAAYAIGSEPKAAELADPIIE